MPRAPRRPSKATARLALAALALLLALLVFASATGGPLARARRGLAAARGWPVPLDEVYPDVPWTRLVPTLAPLAGVGGVRASDCGRCHVQHYEEWRRSTHANAYNDLQLQSELAKPGQPAWLCLNCHIPVENQRTEVVDALVGGALSRPLARPSPSFDPALRDEGVTCAVCHLRRDQRGRTYVLGSRGDTRPPHPVRVDREALARRCDDCHDQTYRLTETLVCHFQTGTELRAGPYAGQRRCVDCHMPASERPLVSLEGAPVRTAHGHAFIGGGVPKTMALVDEQEALGYRPALDVDFEVLPGAAPGGDTVEVALRLRNARAGHRVPTGDPERHVVVEAELVDAEGRVLGRSWVRIGQLWRWEPVAVQVFDNRLRPGEERALQLSLRAGHDRGVGFTPGPEPSDAVLPQPPGAGPPTGVRITATHVRLTDDNAGYMKRTARGADPRFAPAIAEIDRHYPMARTFFRAERELAQRPGVPP